MSPVADQAPDAPPVVVIGAGLAGLAAAVTLYRAGRAVCLVEAGDGVGGRVRSDRTADGFILDRGFQFLFTAYPALNRLYDLPALHLCPFDSGALIAGAPAMAAAVDPFAHPQWLPQLLVNSPFQAGDLLRLLRLKLELMGPGSYRLVRAVERTTDAELADAGFSRSARERFFGPFFGGLLLDPSLGTRAASFLLLFKMLSEGRMAIPRDGMGALAAQLAAHLPPGSIHLNTAVSDIERSADGSIAAVCTGQARFPASAVILAADLWSARTLYPELPVHDPLGCTTIYFRSSRPLYRHRLMVLNPNPTGFLNRVVQLTNIAPSYAPPGQHLLSCTSLTGQHLDEATIEQRSRTELRQWFGEEASGLRCVGIYRLDHAQFGQPPHWRDRRPSIRTGTRGLYLAGEYMQSSSINGALLSGVEAARAVLGDRR